MPPLEIVAALAALILPMVWLLVRLWRGALRREAELSERQKNDEWVMRQI